MNDEDTQNEINSFLKEIYINNTLSEIDILEKRLKRCRENIRLANIGSHTGDIQ